MNSSQLHPTEVSPSAAADSGRPSGGKWRAAWPWALAAGIAVALLVGCLISFQLGKILAGQGDSGGPPSSDVTTWTCSMHPQVKLPKPGKCPICFMDLIPLEESAAGDRPRELVMSPEAVALAGIQTTPVRREFVSQRLRLVGKVAYDETKVAYIAARVPGRLDRLYIDYTGVTVRKGDHLVEMYSPELIVAQRELIQAAANYERYAGQRNDQLLLTTLNSVEEKLRLLGLTAEQIDAIKQKKAPSEHVTIYAPMGGVVIHKNANEGVYVETGTRIYTIADLSQVWVFINAYESDVPWLRYGQEVEFTTETYPGEVFRGRVAFIDPVLDENTRTVKVRVNVPNEARRLKPGMFVRATIKSRVAEGGQTIDDSMAGKWVSPHHPEIIRDGPGVCPICGIELVPAEELGFVKADAGAEAPLVIPETAPLITGKRAVVYVRVPDAKEPTFEGREVLLGKRAGDHYVVRHGLGEGEEVVTRGNFKIDSALQISAKPSMMSSEGELIAAGGEGPEAAGHAAHVSAPLEIPAEFRASLGPVYRAYLAAGDALADDDLAAARTQLQALIAAAKKVDARSLEQDARGRWKTASDQIIVSAYESLDAEDRQAVRRRYEPLSEAMLPLVQAFGHALEAPLVQFHCSMAFDNRGATWLQTEQPTRNPYFGSEMLACGDPMATFHPQVPLDVPAAFRDQLNRLSGAYFRSQTEMASARSNESLAAAEELRKALQSIDPRELNERTGQSWMLAASQLRDALGDASAATDIESLRGRFEGVSLALLGIADSFGHSLQTSLFKVYCPMAFDNRGAPWLQAAEQVDNPYFGAKMRRCGSVQRTYAPSSEVAP